MFWIYIAGTPPVPLLQSASLNANSSPGFLEPHQEHRSSATQGSAAAAVWSVDSHLLPPHTQGGRGRGRGHRSLSEAALKLKSCRGCNLTVRFIPSRKHSSASVITDNPAVGICTHQKSQSCSTSAVLL